MEKLLTKSSWLIIIIIIVIIIIIIIIIINIIIICTLNLIERIRQSFFEEFGQILI